MTENNPPPTAAAAEAAVAAAAEGEQPAPPNQLQTLICQHSLTITGRSTTLPGQSPIDSPLGEVPADLGEKVAVSHQTFPLWNFGTPMGLRVYVSENEEIEPSFSKPLWQEEKPIILGDWDLEISAHVNISIPETVQNNGSLYAHIYLHHWENDVDPKSPTYRKDRVLYKKKRISFPKRPSSYVMLELNKYRKKRKEVKLKKLLGGDGEEEGVEELKDDIKPVAPEEEIISYWWRNLTLNVVTEAGAIPLAQFPKSMKDHIQLDPFLRKDEANQMNYHMPILFDNEFWLLEEKLTPINETTLELPLHIRFYPISIWKFQLYCQMGDSLKQQRDMFGSTASEIDQLKNLLMDTNPWLLGFTMVVTMLHSLFDFLAFKNDIQFWKDRKDVAGISIRTILLNIFLQAVILLYLLDRNDETSWLILMSSGIGLAIEVWKVKKALDVTVLNVEGGIIPYRLQIKQKASYTESRTDEYDAMAFKYLSWVAYPLLAAYAIYSMLYHEHKSWYSFILATLVGYVYAFGFIAMTPQLFINYKLKSVAHMPWKTFMYKALNTFVDDLFAFFIIKMPLLHRLACLRDDLVFFVYLYQRWIYPMDATRPNEYGQVAPERKQD